MGCIFLAEADIGSPTSSISSSITSMGRVLSSVVLSPPFLLHIVYQLP